MKVTILEPVTVEHYSQSQVCPMCKVEKEQNLKRHLIVWVSLHCGSVSLSSEHLHQIITQYNFYIEAFFTATFVMTIYYTRTIANQYISKYQIINVSLHHAFGMRTPSPSAALVLQPLCSNR